MTEFTNNKPCMDEAYYVRPQAAWERMRAAKNSRQTVYIYGMSESGELILRAQETGNFLMEHKEEETK